MTRYARAKRDKCAQEGNSTPWSELVKTVLPSSKADSGEPPSKTESTDDSSSNKVESSSENLPKPKAKQMKPKFEKSLVNSERKDKVSSRTIPTKATEKKKKKRQNTSDMIADTTNESASEPRKKKKKLKKSLAAKIQLESGAIPPIDDASAGKKKAKKRKSEDIGAEVDEKGEGKKKKLKKNKSKSDNSTESPSTAPKKKERKKKEAAEPPVRPPDFLANILKKLAKDEECKAADGMKRKVRKMVEEGELVGKEAGLVVRKWKTRERQRLHKEAKRGGEEATAAPSTDIKQKRKEPKKKQAPEESTKTPKPAKSDNIKPKPQEPTMNAKSDNIKSKPQEPTMTAKSDNAKPKPQESMTNTKSNFPAKDKSFKSLSDNELTEMADKMATQTLYDVKQLVNSYVDAGKLSRKDAGMVVKKWRDRERRRVSRGVRKQDNAVCFHCRQAGHILADCPSVDSTESGSGICFKCGSTEHKSSRCTRKDVKGFPFASCFVCKQQGHLSRDCEQNPNGIYPDGGSCNLCGSQKHLRRDCPTLLGTEGAPPLTIATLSNAQTTRSADADDAAFVELGKLPVHNKGVKVVKF